MAVAEPVKVGVVSVVGSGDRELRETVGATVLTTTEPELEYADSLSTWSLALTLKYQVPSARAVVWVKELVEEVEDETPEEKSDD